MDDQFNAVRAHFQNDGEIDGLREKLMGIMEKELEGRTTEANILDAIKAGKGKEVVLELQRIAGEDSSRDDYLHRIFPKSIYNAIRSYE